MWADGGGGVTGESEEVGLVDWGSSWRLSASRIGSYAAADVLVMGEEPGRSGATEERLASDSDESEGLLDDEGARAGLGRAVARRRGWCWSSQRAAMEMRLAAIGRTTGSGQAITEYSRSYTLPITANNCPLRGSGVVVAVKYRPYALALALNKSHVVCQRSYIPLHSSPLLARQPIRIPRKPPRPRLVSSLPS